MFTLLSGAAVAAEGQTAFRAFSVIAAEEGLSLIGIAGCEGTPEPERWHLILFDPASDTGLRDYTVADGRIVARNGVSQFFAEVRPEDVLLAGSVTIDSDRAGWIARSYAAANRLPLVSLNYHLRRDILGGAPVWKITCFDAEQRQLGWLVISGNEETVIAQHGFEKTPVVDQLPSGRSSAPASSPRPKIAKEVRRALPVEPRERPHIDPLAVVRKLLPF